MRARVLAPLLAAVLGIAGGITTALLAPSSSETPAADADPLRIGITLRDQPCTGDAISVVGYGDNAAALNNAATNAGPSAHYLRYEDSCDTVYGPTNDPHPAYAVYTGPYPTSKEPCAVRMQGAADRGSVTILKSGNEDFVKCSCVLGDDAGPRLEVDMDADEKDVTWIRLLQVMLHDDDPEAFPRSWVTGDYDTRTAERVARLQATSPGKKTVAGVVDTVTWGILNQRLCRNYSW